MNTDDDTTRPTAPSMTNANTPSSAFHQPPPGAHLMNVLRWVLFAFLLVLAMATITSYALSKRPESGSKETSAKVVYQCPMHPSFTSDKPGECPICGMTLEPVKVGDAGHQGAGQEGDVPGLTSVHITPDRVQLIGVRTALVERSALGGQLELVGFVTPDESRLKRVQIRVSGWVRRLYANQTGERVSMGQPLLAIYSPELFQSEQEYLIQRGGRDSLASADPRGVHRAAVERLALLGVPEEEIRRVDREGTASTELILRSPVTGTVLDRGVVEGQYVGADTPLLTVSDLSRIWVMMDVYEMDIARVRVGDAAQFTADAFPGRSLGGHVQFIYPTISNATRTLKARLALENRNSDLRPGMYGRVQVAARGGSALSVPGEAVINTGRHSYVFLAHEGGQFEPRMVWTGTSEGDRVQVLKGVAEGDTVVASASFLIDSESRLRAAVAGMGAQPGMTGMDHQHGGTP